MRIDETTTTDTPEVLAVERAAFGQDDEPDLVLALLDDPSAAPLLSLLAREGERPVGHILFTAVHLREAPDAGPMVILAPMAVVPEAQGHGIGTALIEQGLQLLRASGVQLVFVLGHPGYYPRHGFEPAGPLGFATPFPIPDEVADAWMVQALRPGVIGTVRGTVVCADVLDDPELWQE